VPEGGGSRAGLWCGGGRWAGVARCPGLLHKVRNAGGRWAMVGWAHLADWLVNGVLG
jgi:hypothetical protein